MVILEWTDQYVVAAHSAVFCKRDSRGRAFVAHIQYEPMNVMFLNRK
jgi:hypothetical protein